MMEIVIKTRGSVILTDEMRTFADHKVRKLEKFISPGDTTALADVELASVSKSRTGDLFRAEINLSFAGGFIRAEASRETLHAAIDKAVSEARREMRVFRTKHRDLMRRGAAKVKKLFRRFQKE
ncbi:MAG: ribosome-associated translation inhibitor RaiA [Patescibacteria group bacterium]|nr:ribosome-associated translation inhibitor RaiA [Patescibacteria group bacterium]